MVAASVAMVAACVLQVVLVGRDRVAGRRVRDLLCPVLMLLAMVDTCLLGTALLSGTAWAVVLLAAAGGVLLAHRDAGPPPGWHLAALAITATLLALPATAAPSAAAEETTAMAGMEHMAGMSGMHHGDGAVPAPLWWLVLLVAAAYVVVALGRVVAARRRASDAPTSWPRLGIALGGVVEVGLMAAMVLPATT